MHRRRLDPSQDFRSLSSYFTGIGQGPRSARDHAIISGMFCSSDLDYLNYLINIKNVDIRSIGLLGETTSSQHVNLRAEGNFDWAATGTDHYREDRI